MTEVPAIATASASGAGLTPVEAEIGGELSRSFGQRFAARIERPAVYLLCDHGGQQWLGL